MTPTKAPQKPRIWTTDVQMLKPRLQSTRPRQTQPERWGSGRGGRPWRRLRQAILLRDQYTCRACGLVGGELELDHIVNVARGGTDDPANLQILCRSCHAAKTARESSGLFDNRPGGVGGG